MLLPRILTAIIGVPLVLAAIHIGNLPYMFFIFTIIALSLYEYSVLMKLGQKPVQNSVLFIFGLLIPLAFILDSYSQNMFGGNNFAICIFTAAFIVSVIVEIFSSKKYLERIAFTLFGIVLISWNLSYLMGIRNINPDGEGLTFIIIISVWIMDTAAYAGGRMFGKRRLSSISPKKTWEGAIAGFITAIASVLLVRLFLKDSVPVPMALGIGLLIGIIAQMSDLAESMIKRAVGVKDSSNLLPGHGGILDRFDSYIFLAPAIYYFVILIR